jgi:hypothetical protein
MTETSMHPSISCKKVEIHCRSAGGLSLVHFSSVEGITQLGMGIGQLSQHQDFFTEEKQGIVLALAVAKEYKEKEWRKN